FLGHSTWVAGGLRQALAGFFNTAGAAGLAGKTVGEGVLWNLFGLWGPAGLAAAFVGGCAGVIGRGRARRLGRLGMLALIPGIANVFAFRSHSASHEFWSMAAAPGYALLAAAGLAWVRSLTERRPIAIRYALCSLLAGAPMLL